MNPFNENELCDLTFRVSVASVKKAFPHIPVTKIIEPPLRQFDAVLARQIVMHLMIARFGIPKKRVARLVSRDVNAINRAMNTVDTRLEDAEFEQHYRIMREIASASGTSERAVNKAAKKHGWRLQESKVRRATGTQGGGGWEYHFSLLPYAVQARLMMVHGAPANANANKAEEARSKIWAAYEGLSKGRKAACEARLKVMVEVALLITGVREMRKVFCAAWSFSFLS